MADTTETSTGAEIPPQKPRRRWRQRWWAIVVGVGVVVGLPASGIVIWEQVVPHHHQVFAFTDPPPDGVTPEPCAFTASGRGAPPAGQVVVVSNQVQGTGDNIDHLLHFGRATRMPNTDKWYADVQIGIPSTKPGTAYTLTAWLAPADVVNGLIAATPGHHAWWNNDNPPTGAKQIASANVTRNTVAKCWH